MFNSITLSSIQISLGVCDSHLCECVFALSSTPPHVASFRKPAEMINDGFIVWFSALPDIMIVKMFIFLKPGFDCHSFRSHSCRL